MGKEYKPLSDREEEIAFRLSMPHMPFISDSDPDFWNGFMKFVFVMSWKNEA